MITSILGAITMVRFDGRLNMDLRPVRITRNYLPYAEGSVLIEIGNTRVICTASIEEKVPAFLKKESQGWVTAEYSMLPRATQVRTVRESSKGKLSGRTYEIQRLIGRALRSVTDLKQLGERTIWIDCDVIQADGGTRTAALTGSFIAMVDAMNYLCQQGLLQTIPITDFLAAVSVGILECGELVLDLAYEEDSKCRVDMNIVMTGKGEYVEIQGTGESAPFTAHELTELLHIAQNGIMELIGHQKAVLGDMIMKIGQIDG